MYYIKEAYRFMENSFSILKKGEWQFRGEYFLVMIRTLLKIKGVKEKKIRLLGKTIRIPNNFIAFLVLQEIFVAELYKRLQGSNHVLDLGGYIGDSGLYLSEHNQKVTIIESDPRNFHFLEKNLKHIKNVTYYQAAIVADESQDFFLIEDNEYRGSIATTIKPDTHSIQIPTMSIQKLLKENEFDCIKMDIEGGEYPILEYCIQNKDFPFKKGFIEFHFFEQEHKKQKKDFLNFLYFLGTNKYYYDIFDNAGKLVSTVNYINDLQKDFEKTEYINIYFEKKDF